MVQCLKQLYLPYGGQRELELQQTKANVGNVSIWLRTMRIVELSSVGFGSKRENVRLHARCPCELASEQQSHWCTYPWLAKLGWS